MLNKANIDNTGTIFPRRLKKFIKTPYDKKGMHNSIWLCANKPTLTNN
ncbi:hypothetical protein MDMS009_512 [Methylophaga thiooxydans DMS010]|uniref:Uncharacterized protein n=1 Tax=Methylophaga thiooxydans DMS010 TaxID=637616 RepID=C0N2S9_9GAMM|nr:hypothetical protein MDMS009_512 [Methylophaga thiooxydans DMS010]